MEPFIVIIFGASGSGKTSLMEMLQKAGKQYSIHMKATDRAPRKYDDIEIECVNEVSHEIYDYIYQTYGHRYGIQKLQIDKAIAEGRHHFIICNDISTIKSLKRDYGNLLKVIFLTFDAPREKLLEIQRSRNIDDDEIELRVKKINTLYRIFTENKELFDEVLPNSLDEDIYQMKIKMESILMGFRKQEEFERSRGVLDRLNTLAKSLETKFSYNDISSAKAIEPGYIFVIMAMKEDDPGLEDVHTTIKRTCSDQECKAERVDEIQFTGQITEKIQGSIRIAELVVADLT